MAASVESNVDWVKIENSFNGKSYFWKVASSETMHSIPPDVARQVEAGEVKLDIQEVDPTKDGEPARQWQKVQDKEGRIYWWNLRTDETTWRLPVMGPAGKNVGDSSAGHQRSNSIEALGAAAGVKVINGVDGIMQLNAAGSGNKAPESTCKETAAPASSRRRFGFHRIGSKEEVKEKKDRSFKKKEGGTLDSVIRRRVKEGKGRLDVQDVVKNMEMSSPYQVEHKVHVRFDQKGVRYSGLPSDWAEGARDEKEVFGVSVTSCPRLDVAGYVERIPAVLVMLKQAVMDMGGYQAEGLFRIAPDKEECDRVKAKLNDCAGVQALNGVTDPHVPANLIKQFFRELQPNLLNCLKTEKLKMLALLSEQDREKAGQKILDICQPEQSCLLWLLDMLAEVAQLRDVNRMTPKNLAIVLSPNLYDMADCPPMEALVLSQRLAVLLENLLVWRIEECHETDQDHVGNEETENAEDVVGNEETENAEDVANETKELVHVEPEVLQSNAPSLVA